MRNLIEQYVRGASRPQAAIEGLSRQELLAHPVPATWSIQQIVLHLMDSDLIMTDRMKRIIAEDNPTLIGFDESKFAANLHYDEQSAEDAAALFEMNRRLFAKVLHKLPESALERFGTHNERGRLTLRQLLETAINHLEHHLKFLMEKRKRLGK